MTKNYRYCTAAGNPTRAKGQDGPCGMVLPSNADLSVGHLCHYHGGTTHELKFDPIPDAAPTYWEPDYEPCKDGRLKYRDRNYRNWVY